MNGKKFDVSDYCALGDSGSLIMIYISNNTKFGRHFLFLNVIELNGWECSAYLFRLSTCSTLPLHL